MKYLPSPHSEPPRVKFLETQRPRGPAARKLGMEPGRSPSFPTDPGLARRGGG